MTVRYWASPKAGDIVQCRFPEDAFDNPGPKVRPALVTRVDVRENIVDVEVAYGTSQGTADIHAGELLVEKDDPDAGLQKDTKFDLCNIVKLPFNEEWFASDPLERFGKHPKRGKLNLANVQNKKKLHAAVIEAKQTAKAKRRKARLRWGRTMRLPKPRLPASPAEIAGSC